MIVGGFYTDIGPLTRARAKPKAGWCTSDADGRARAKSNACWHESPSGIGRFLREKGNWKQRGEQQEEKEKESTSIHSRVLFLPVVPRDRDMCPWNIGL